MTVRAVVEQFRIPEEKAKLIVRMARNDFEPATKNLYVIRLGDSEGGESILDHKKFMAKNPLYRCGSGKPCVYVGQTALDPKARFRQHKSGHKASPIAKKYGICLMEKKYEHLNPVPASEAEAREEALARRLQRKGYAVWWN